MIDFSVSSPSISVILIALVALLVVLTSVRRLPDLGVVISLVVIALVVWLRPGDLEQLGFQPVENWARVLALGLALGTVLSLGAITLLEPLSERLTGVPHDIHLIDPIRGDRGATLRLLVLVWVLAAPVEEVLFRGFLMNEFAALLGTSSWALLVNLILTSVLFGLAHWYQGQSGVLSTGVVGLLLGALFIWTGFNIWPVIFTHAFIDTVSLLLVYSNLDRRLNHIFLEPQPAVGEALDGISHASSHVDDIDPLD